jgi:hypothetical protein
MYIIIIRDENQELIYLSPSEFLSAREQIDP